LDSLPALAAGEVDLAVTHSYSNVAQTTHPGVESTQISQEEVFLAVPRTGSSTPPSEQHPQADPVGEAARLADYARESWIVPHHRWSCYEMVERACGLAGFAPQAVAEATDFSTQLALVAAGVGVAPPRRSPSPGISVPRTPSPAQPRSPTQRSPKPSQPPQAVR
jgi:DNA-binding transcriptional LysR family regulator